MAGTESSSTVSSKRRRLDISPDHSLLSNNFELEENEQLRLVSMSTAEKTFSSVITLNSCGEHSSGDSPASSVLSSNEIAEVAKSGVWRTSDLESKSFETENSTFISDNKFSTERDQETPSSTFHGDTDDMDSPALVSNTQSINSTLPSQEEIEKFFEAAEKVQKEERKRFTEKYNFDIVKDLPMEGRYQWVRVKPSN